MDVCSWGVFFFFFLLQASVLFLLSIVQKPEGETTIEDEMGLTGAAADDAEAEVIRRVCDSHLVIGDSAMLARLQPIVVYICTNPSQFTDSRLQAAAALALAKLMLVRSVP